MGMLPKIHEQDEENGGSSFYAQSIFKKSFE